MCSCKRTVGRRRVKNITIAEPETENYSKETYYYCCCQQNEISLRYLGEVHLPWSAKLVTLTTKSKWQMLKKYYQRKATDDKNRINAIMCNTRLPQLHVYWRMKMMRQIVVQKESVNDVVINTELSAEKLMK